MKTTLGNRIFIIIFTPLVLIWASIDGLIDGFKTGWHKVSCEWNNEDPYPNGEKK